MRIFALEPTPLSEIKNCGDSTAPTEWENDTDTSFPSYLAPFPRWGKYVAGFYGHLKCSYIEKDCFCLPQSAPRIISGIPSLLAPCSRAEAWSSHRRYWDAV